MRVGQIVGVYCIEIYTRTEMASDKLRNMAAILEQYRVECTDPVEHIRHYIYVYVTYPSHGSSSECKNLTAITVVIYILQI